MLFLQKTRIVAKDAAMLLRIFLEGYAIHRKSSISTCFTFLGQGSNIYSTDSVGGEVFSISEHEFMSSTWDLEEIVFYRMFYDPYYAHSVEKQPIRVSEKADFLNPYTYIVDIPPDATNNPFDPKNKHDVWIMPSIDSTTIFDLINEFKIDNKTLRLLNVDGSIQNFDGSDIFAIDDNIDLANILGFQIVRKKEPKIAIEHYNDSFFEADVPFKAGGTSLTVEYIESNVLRVMNPVSGQFIDMKIDKSGGILTNAKSVAIRAYSDNDSQGLSLFS